jgi:tRNA uridine 5-carbamoylmethylation protein Kti12
VIDTQLILIEGLPGSGKTTLAKFLSAQLIRHDMPVRCLLEETQPHPLHTAASPHIPETFAQGILQTWQAYIAQTGQSEIITIADGILFQNAIRLLMQNGMERQRIMAYADAIEVAI